MMNVPENSISVPTLDDRPLSCNISSLCPDGQRTQGRQPTTINKRREEGERKGRGRDEKKIRYEKKGRDREKGRNERRRKGTRREGKGE